jgi:VWFA-related protein
MSKIACASLCFAVLVFGVWAGNPAAAQQPPAIPMPRMPQPPPGSQPSEPQDQTPDEKPAATFKVASDLVQTFFNVKDHKGGLIPDLKKEDFQVLEDGKPQTIKYFTENSDLPLTLGILIDASASQTRVLSSEKEVGGIFLRDVLRDKDLAFVLSFDVNVELLQDFTNSTRRLQAALDKAKINAGTGMAMSIPGIGSGPVPTANAPRGTLLFDAVYLASHDELSQQVGRKAMILLTDGEDQGSQLRLRDAIEAAQKSDSICYVLLLADRAFYGGAYSGEGDMAKLTKETGGRMIEIGNKVDKLREAFDQIARELRSQYSIGYTPTNVRHDGGFRKLEIRTKDGYKVQARGGYYAPAGDSN